MGYLGTSTDIQSLIQHKSAFLKTPVNLDQTPGSGGDNMFGGTFQQSIMKDNFGHKDIVTDLLMLPKLQYLASCSLDKKVILWDTITGE